MKSSRLAGSVGRFGLDEEFQVRQGIFDEMFATRCARDDDGSVHDIAKIRQPVVDTGAIQTELLTLGRVNGCK